MKYNRFRIEGICKIWLVDTGDEIIWSDCPTPDIEYDDSTGYVRADIVEELKKENELMKKCLLDVKKHLEIVGGNNGMKPISYSIVNECLDKL